jgi:hypothetical protein
MKTESFADYSAYKEAQVALNLAKIDRVFVTRQSLERLVKALRQRIGRDIKSGLCHGVRNGFEVNTLRELIPGSNIIGTDISSTATQFGCVEHDFHEPREEWIGAFDFVYSNAWDHAYDFRKARDAWMNQLAPGGVCVFHWSKYQAAEGVHGGDCFGCSVEELVALGNERHHADPPIYAGNSTERWPRQGFKGTLHDVLDRAMRKNREYFVLVKHAR